MIVRYIFLNSIFLFCFFLKRVKRALTIKMVLIVECAKKWFSFSFFSLFVCVMHRLKLNLYTYSDTTIEKNSFDITNDIKEMCDSKSFQHHHKILKPLLSLQDIQYMVHLSVNFMFVITILYFVNQNFRLSSFEDKKFRE